MSKPVTGRSEDPRLARLVRRSVEAALQGAGRRGRRALPRVRPGRRISVRAGAQVHAVRRLAGAALRAARPPRLRPQRDRAGDLPRRRQPRDGRCAACIPAARRAGVATVKRSVTDAELQAMHEAGVRGVRFNFVKRLVDFTPQGRADRDRRPHRAARLACRDLFRGGGPARAVGLLHRAADHGRGRPHGPARRDQAGRRSRVRAVREVHARAPERLVQGELPGAAVGHRSAGAERRAAMPIATWCRSPGASSRPFPTACSGAPTGRTRT